MTFIFPRGHISGLTLSTAGLSNTFSVTAGQASDSTNAVIMNFAAAMAKTTGAWVAGTTNGSLDTGSIAASTWYHVHLIQTSDGTGVDILTSLSATAPTLPATYTIFRRIGSMKTDGASLWILFTQLGDEFLWSVPSADVGTTTLGTTATLFALSTPPGVQTIAHLRGTLSNAIVADVLINSPDEAVAVWNVPVGNQTMRNPVANVSQPLGELAIRTNTSSQIRAVGDTSSTTLVIITVGWTDTRGRFA